MDKVSTRKDTLPSQVLLKDLPEDGPASGGLNGFLPDNTKRFRDLFDFSPLSTFEVNLASKPPKILRVNRRAEEVFGWTAQELVLGTVERIIAPESVAVLRLIAQSLQTEEKVTLETNNQRSDGSLFPVRIHATTEDPQDLTRTIWMIEDLTFEKERRGEEQAIAEERRRIAREIHDGLIQNLAGLRFRMRHWHRLVDVDPQLMHEELDLLQDILDTCITDTRRSIMALRPSILEDQGFYASLQQFLSYFSYQYDLPARLEVIGARDHLPSNIELSLFRVVQEGMNNVWKHAHAGRVWVTLDLSSPHQVIASVHDDGDGIHEFDLDGAFQTGHLGLHQMRERVEALGGRLEIRSQAGQGTDLTVFVPR